MPGINDEHVEAVAEEMRALGADVMNCIPLYPVAGTPFAEIGEIAACGGDKDPRRGLARSFRRWNTARDAGRMRSVCWERISLRELVSLMRDSANGLLDDRSGRPYVAVASMEGILVNQHLGEADELWIFEYDEIKPKLVAMRETPEARLRHSALARPGQDD